MANFKIVISEPETRKSYQLEIDQEKTIGLIGKKIGEEVNGEIIGLSDYTLKITGGTDKDGFPMIPSLKGPGRRKVLLTGPPGFYPKKEGQRKRKTIRGDTISLDIAQINLKVTKKGDKPLEELIPTKPKEKKEEKKPEEKPKEVKKEKVEKKEESKTEIKEKTEEKKEGGEKPTAGKK